MYRFAAVCCRSGAAVGVVVVIAGLYPRTRSDQGCGMVASGRLDRSRPASGLDGRPSSAEDHGLHDLLGGLAIRRGQWSVGAVIEDEHVPATNDEVGQIPRSAARIGPAALDPASSEASDARRRGLDGLEGLDVLALIPHELARHGVQGAAALLRSGDGDGFTIEPVVIVRA